MRQVLLVRFGEVHLKGQNRPYFLHKLTDNVKKAVAPLNARVWLSDGRIYVSDFEDIQQAIDRVTRVFGLYSVSPAWELDKDYELIAHKCEEMTRGLKGTFKVMARRSDKHFPMNSQQLNAETGRRDAGRRIPICAWTFTSPTIMSALKFAIMPTFISTRSWPWAACPWARAARPCCCSPAASTARWPASS